MAASYARDRATSPFIDGNKRTGFGAAAVFLETNGLRLTATEIEATVATLGLADGTLSKEACSRWLAEHTEKTETEL